MLKANLSSLNFLARHSISGGGHGWFFLESSQKERNK
jgi:hypothetical protein